MYKKTLNAIKRARTSTGITQERLAEMAGYSVDAIKAWESGTRRASIEVLEMLGTCLNAPWLTSIYLREGAGGGPLENVIPDFVPGTTLSQSALQLIDRIYAFADNHSDRKLISIAADNVITPEEREAYDAIMADLLEITQAALTLRFSRQESDISER